MQCALHNAERSIMPGVRRRSAGFGRAHTNYSRNSYQHRTPTKETYSQTIIRNTTPDKEHINTTQIHRKDAHFLEPPSDPGLLVHCTS